MENTFAQRFTLLQEAVNRGFAETATTLHGIARTILVLADRLERVEGKVDDLARDFDLPVASTDAIGISPEFGNSPPAHRWCTMQLGSAAATQARRYWSSTDLSRDVPDPATLLAPGLDVSGLRLAVPAGDLAWQLSTLPSSNKVAAVGPACVPEPRCGALNMMPRPPFLTDAVG